MFQRRTGYQDDTSVPFFASDYGETGKYRLRRKKWIRYGIGIFIATCIVLKLAYNVYMGESPQQASFRLALEIAHRGTFILDTVRSDFLDDSYEVTDRGWMTHEDELRVYRNVFTIGENRSWLTTAKLQTPTVITQANLNTADWAVDIRALAMNYKRMLAMAPFFAETLSFAETASGEILAIGLRGAGLTNFLHFERTNVDITVAETDPVVKDIAVKWFGLRENNRYRVILTSGINLLKERIHDHKKFDVVLLDSCYFGYEHPIVCPTEPYLDADHIRLIKDVLPPHGIMAANVFALSDHKENFEKVLNTYKAIFDTCLMLDVMLEPNKILVCYKRKIEDEDGEKEKINKAIENIKIQFGLDFWDKY